MKARQFKDEAARVASFLAGKAGITPGYWRQMIHHDQNIPPERAGALADAVEAYAGHLLSIAKNLRSAADLPGTASP